MSCLWICLSLLCSAFLQSTASSSSDKSVLLRCNETVKVEAGENVTLNCTIIYRKVNASISNTAKFIWSNTGDNIPCDNGSGKYICEWDQLTYVSLTISNVTTEENYTVEIHVNSGMAKSSPIKVQVKPSTISSETAVLLRCNETVKVEAGENVTLNCTIIYQNMSPSHSDGCSVLKVTWNDTSGNIPCDSGSRKYICEWDQKNYVSLTISNVTTEENYTIAVLTDCGMAKSSPIKVQVDPIKPTQAPEQNITPVLIICIICISIIVVGVFYVLFGTNHGRKIRKLIMRDKTRGEHRDSKEDAEAPLTTDPQV